MIEVVTCTFVAPDGRRFPHRAEYQPSPLLPPGESAEVVRFMYEEGNYSCDCSRSGFIRAADPTFPELPCGEAIEMEDFKIELVASPPPDLDAQEGE